MPDNERLKGPADRSRVSMEEKYERAYWSKKFGVTGVSLAAAVRKVGNSAEDVKEFFKQKRKTAAKKARATAKAAGGAKKTKRAKAA
jgi:hypothetical protein